MPTVMQLRRKFDKQNAEAAVIVAGQPEKYKGLLATWARGILEHERGEAPVKRVPDKSSGRQSRRNLDAQPAAGVATQETLS